VWDWTAWCYKHWCPHYPLHMFICSLVLIRHAGCCLSWESATEIHTKSLPTTYKCQSIVAFQTAWKSDKRWSTIYFRSTELIWERVWIKIKGKKKKKPGTGMWKSDNANNVLFLILIDLANPPQIWRITNNTKIKIAVFPLH